MKIFLRDCMNISLLVTYTILRCWTLIPYPLFQIKTFGFLVKGLRIGLELLNMLRKEDHGMPSISLFVNIPNLSSLDDLLNQFEIALEDDFPHYQVCHQLWIWHTSV